MTQGDEESAEDWYKRAVDEFRESQAELTEHTIRLGLDRPIAIGYLHQIVDDRFEAALDRFDDAALKMFQAARAASANR